jgi:hypothetical protein
MKLNVSKKQREALKKLAHPGGPLDLTGNNVQKMKDIKAKRDLEPLLQKVLPRRRKGIEHSSYYRSMRANLLPVNPHFQRDVADLRQLLQIPAGHIAITDFEEPSAKGEHPYDKNGSARVAQAAGHWLHIHRSVALNKTWEVDDLPPVPEWLPHSASIMIEFGQAAPLDWLKQNPIIPSLYASYFQLSVPLDYCVARLIERYRLPWLCGCALEFFILTLNAKYLKHIFPFDVLIEPVDVSVGMGYRITIDWIDEFTTERQWREIWRKAMVPRLERFWEERGEYPYSKRPEVESLTESWVIELYKLIVEQPETGIDSALEQLALNEKLPAGGGDRTTAYRAVRRLERLMEPVD